MSNMVAYQRKFVKPPWGRKVVRSKFTYPQIATQLIEIVSNRPKKVQPKKYFGVNLIIFGETFIFLLLDIKRVQIKSFPFHALERILHMQN